MTDLIYLGSPYSHNDPDVMENRYQEVCRHAAILMRQGFNVYAPIAATHGIASYELPKGWDYWEKYDRIFLTICSSLTILMLPGWGSSKGLMGEVSIMRRLQKPINFMRVED